MERDSSEKIEQVYSGEHGEEYSRSVLSTSDDKQNAIARNRSRKLGEYVSENERVLEIGVGLGTNLRYLQCQEKVGFDIGDYGKEACEAYGIEFCSALDELGDRKFSTVILHHVIEHVPNPLETIESAKGFLSDDGKILIFVPNDAPRRERKYRQDDPNHHLYSWSALTLGNLVESSGLRIEEIRTRPFGYERFLAPVNKFGDTAYRAALFLLRLVRPVSEIFVLARQSPQAMEQPSNGSDRVETSTRSATRKVA